MVGHVSRSGCLIGGSLLSPLSELALLIFVAWMASVLSMLTRTSFVGELVGSTWVGIIASELAEPVAVAPC